MLAIHVENRKWWMCISAVAVVPMIRWKAAGDTTADFTGTVQQFTYYNIHVVQTLLHTCTSDTRNVSLPDMPTSMNCNNLKFLVNDFSWGSIFTASCRLQRARTNYRHRLPHPLTGHREDTIFGEIRHCLDYMRCHIVFFILLL